MLDDISRSEFNMMEFTFHNFGHNEWHHSKDVLKRHSMGENSKRLTTGGCQLHLSLHKNLDRRYMITI